LVIKLNKAIKKTPLHKKGYVGGRPIRRERVQGNKQRGAQQIKKKI